MACTLWNPVSLPSCVGDVAKSVAGDAFSSIAHDFGQAADSSINWLWAQIQAATGVSLAGRNFGLDLGIVAAIAATVAVGLFVIQLIASTLRRDPSGLARAVKGLVLAFIGGGVSIGVVNLLLKVIDDLSAGVVQAATGGSIQQMGHAILAAGSVSASTQNPAGIMLLSLAALAAVVMVWAALMVRKVLIVVTAVFAPLAFAGSLADITVAWTRRWVETTVALIVSKLILMLIFVVGLGMLVDGVGRAGSGPTQVVTQTVSGMLVLALAGFAPWLALKTVHFVGDQANHLHVLASTSTAGAAKVHSAAQKAQPWLSGALATPAAAGAANGQHARASTRANGPQPLGPGRPGTPGSAPPSGWPEPSSPGGSRPPSTLSPTGGGAVDTAPEPLVSSGSRPASGTVGGASGAFQPGGASTSRRPSASGPPQAARTTLPSVDPSAS